MAQGHPQEGQQQGARERPPVRLASTVLDAPDARELALFYQRLLGWDITQDEPGWVKLEAPGRGAALSFQSEPLYIRPVWPAGPGDPGMMLHLDFAVPDLGAAVAYATAAGAQLAGHQPEDGVRVCFDPAGHPFCFFLPEP